MKINWWFVTVLVTVARHYHVQLWKDTFFFTYIVHSFFDCWIQSNLCKSGPKIGSTHSSYWQLTINLILHFLGSISFLWPETHYALLRTVDLLATEECTIKLSWNIHWCLIKCVQQELHWGLKVCLDWIRELVILLLVLIVPNGTT